MAIEFSDSLLDLQRRADAAWAAVEAHRRAVDAERRSAPRVEVIPGKEPMLRPWTPEEDAKHQRLLAAARDAQQALRDGIEAAGLEPTITVVQGLKAAAKAE